MKAAVNGLGQTYTVEMWIYNGMSGDARPVAGYFFSRGVDGADDAPGDHLGIDGRAAGRQEHVGARSCARQAPSQRTSYC